MDVISQKKWQKIKRSKAVLRTVTPRFVKPPSSCPNAKVHTVILKNEASTASFPKHIREMYPTRLKPFATKYAGHPAFMVAVRPAKGCKR